jgi:hypothetical protein
MSGVRGNRLVAENDEGIFGHLRRRAVSFRSGIWEYVARQRA